MRTLPYNQIDHDRAYNEAWNDLASIWDAEGLIATAPPPKKYTGQKQESYTEGWLACQDYLILERSKLTKHP